MKKLNDLCQALNIRPTGDEIAEAINTHQNALEKLELAIEAGYEMLDPVPEEFEFVEELSKAFAISRALRDGDLGDTERLEFQVPVFIGAVLKDVQHDPKIDFKQYYENKMSVCILELKKGDKDEE